MKQVRNEATHNSSKYKVQLEPFNSEWERFIPTLEKEFLDIFSKMLNHNSQQQQQPLNSNEARYLLYSEREQYRTGTNNRIRTLTTPSQTMTHLNMAKRFHHFSHSTPEALYTCNGNSHFTNQNFLTTQIRGHTHNNAPFRITNNSHKEQGFTIEDHPGQIAHFMALSM